MTVLKRYVMGVSSTNDDDEQPQKTQPLGGLTQTSKEFAQAAIDFATENDMSFDDAVRYLMRQRRDYKATTSAAMELAQIARTVQGALKLSFTNALLSVARQHRDKVKRVADDWLIAQAQTAARGRPGLQAANESAALFEVLSANPEIAQARNSGVLSESALKVIFSQFYK